MREFVELSRTNSLYHSGLPMIRSNPAITSLQIDFPNQERRDLLRTIETIRGRLDCIEHDLARLARGPIKYPTFR